MARFIKPYVYGTFGSCVFYQIVQSDQRMKSFLFISKMKDWSKLTLTRHLVVASQKHALNNISPLTTKINIHAHEQIGSQAVTYTTYSYVRNLALHVNRHFEKRSFAPLQNGCLTQSSVQGPDISLCVRNNLLFTLKILDRKYNYNFVVILSKNYMKGV